MEMPEDDVVLTRQQCSAEASRSAAAGAFAAATTWCSRALSRLGAEQDPCDEALSGPAAALLLRRAEYALQAARGEATGERYAQAVRDADEVLNGARENKALAKAVRVKCRALLALDRREDALAAWRARAGMGSPVLDELAFRREFALAGETREDDDARYDAALQFLYRRDFGNAIALLNKAIDAPKKGKSKNKDPVLFLLRARCRVELKEFEGVVADAERVITLLPTAVEAYRWLCEASIALRKHSHASRVCQLGLSLAPQDQALLELQARLQTNKQDREEKLQYRQKKSASGVVVGSGGQDELAQDKAPEGVEGGRDHVEEEEEGEQEDPRFETIRELKRALKADPRNAELFTRLAGLRFSLQQYEQAQNDAAQAIALNGAAVGGYVRSCEALYALRRYPKALRVCEQGLRMVDGASEALTAELSGWESKLQDAMINPPPEEPIRYTGPMGKSRVPKAVAARKQQRAQRKVDDAQSMRVKCYEKAVDLADDRDFGNAVFWLNKAEEYEAAGKEFYTARILALRARCRFELKQYDHVTKDAERAVALDPTDAESYRWLCLALKARGYTDKARAACASGLEADPGHRQLLSLLKGLQIRNKASSK